MENSCSHNFFFENSNSLSDMCAMATCIGENCCSVNYTLVNFFQIAWCWFGGMWYLVVFLGIIIIFLIFRFISNLVEFYLAPAVAYCSDFTQMSEAMNAVTLLAFANGAGDVVTAFVASRTSGAVSYNIGALFGAGLFVCSIIVALTILISPVKIQLTPTIIWRDIGFYILSGLLMFGFALIGQITWITSVVMLLLYCVLVFIVYIQEKFQLYATKFRQETEELLKETEAHDRDEENNQENDKEKDEGWKSPKSKFKGTVTMAVMQKRTEAEKKLQFIDVAQQKLFEEKFRIKRINNAEQMQRKDFLFYLDYPFNLIERMTLPTCKPDQFGRLQSILFPILGCFFMTFFILYSPSEGVYWDWKWLFSIPVGCVLSLFFYFAIPKYADNLPKIYVVLQLFAITFSLIWTYFVSGILIDLLTFLGVVSDFPTTYMGLTVIAVGNALPDGVTTIALAKRNLAVMGMIGAYAGQLFGLLIGFGLAMLKKTLLEGPQDFDLFNWSKLRKNILDITVISCSLLVLTITFVSAIFNKYELTKKLAYVLLVTYTAFILLSTTIALVLFFD